MVLRLDCFHAVVVLQSGIEILHLAVAGSQMPERPQMIRFQHIGFQISIYSFFIAFHLLQAETYFLVNIRIGLFPVYQYLVELQCFGRVLFAEVEIGNSHQ